MSLVCKLKWNWSTVVLHRGITNSCWMSDKEILEDNNFINFHNTKEKQAQRQLMLDSKWPSGCLSCKSMEDSGAVSNRIIHNIHWGGVANIEESKSTVSKVDVLELYFDNTCNFSCIYCTPMLSNTWNKELKKFGPMPIGEKFVKSIDLDQGSYQRRLKLLWEWLPKNLPALKELNVLGGEPLLLTETQAMLDLIYNNPSTDLDLTIVSNLGISPRVLNATIVKLETLVIQKKIKSAKILASLDSWGTEIEFQRYGIDLEMFENNVTAILKSKQVIFGINATLTCLGLPCLPSLIKKWQEWQALSDNHIHLSCIQVEHNNMHYYLEIGVLPLPLFASAVEEAISMITSNNPSDQLTKQKLIGIYDYVKSQDPLGNKKRMDELRCYLEELSVRRNIDWKMHFPWLVDTLCRY